MSWFWLNIPLAALFFLAATAIPLWLVIRHPDAQAAPGSGRPATDAATAMTDSVAARSSARISGRAGRPAARPAARTAPQPGHAAPQPERTQRQPELAGSATR